MRQLVALLSIAVMALLMAAPTTATARQFHINIDDSFQSGFLSDACGVDVFIDTDGDLQVTLVYNRAGLVAREIDRAGGGTITYRSPDTGNSFSFPIQPSQWDYGSGAVPRFFRHCFVYRADGPHSGRNRLRRRAVPLSRHRRGIR